MIILNFILAHWTDYLLIDLIFAISGALKFGGGKSTFTNIIGFTLFMTTWPIVVVCSMIKDV